LAKQSDAVALLVLVVAVVHQVLVVVVVEVEHIVPHALLPVAVVVRQWLRDIAFVNARLQGIEVLLGVGNVV
jgi:hypothetical protein